MILHILYFNTSILYLYYQSSVYVFAFLTQSLISDRCVIPNTSLLLPYFLNFIYVFIFSKQSSFSDKYVNSDQNKNW